MANIKWIDNDLDAAISFYSMASELDNEKAGKYLGQIYEKRYQQSNLQSDKDLALHFYLKTAKLERTDLGFPPALKAYYNLKYPFITDFSNVSPYWQNENMLPKTKEDYDKSQAAWAAYKIKHKEF
jgi:TPR repeat protein